MTLLDLVFLFVLDGNLLRFPIQGPVVWLIVKGLWGDKCQVSDSPQASNSGGQGLGKQSAALISHVTACLILVFSTEHWARNSTEEEM